MSQRVRRRRGLVVAGLIVVAALGGMWRAGAQEPAATSDTSLPEFIISVGTNRRSELEPCGCAKNQQGGIDREAKHYADREAKGIPVLKLDGGGVIDAAITPHERTKTRFMFRAMHAVGYHAINVTANDVLYGMAALRDETSTLSLLSANIREGGKPELPFAPFRVFEVTTSGGKTVRVGVVGLSGAAQNAVKTRGAQQNGVQTAGGKKVSSALVVPAVPHRVIATQDGGGAPTAREPEQPAVIDPAQTRVIEAEPEGGFEPPSTDDFLYLWARLIPAPRLPRQPERVPKYNDFDYIDWVVRTHLAEGGTSVTAEMVEQAQNPPPLFIPEGTFRSRSEYETSYELPTIAVPTDSRGTLPPSAHEVGGEAGGPAGPAAGTPPGLPAHSSLWQRRSATTAMHWHAGAAKGDTGTPAPSVVEITERDPAVAAAVERARAALSAMPTLESYDRDATQVDVIDPASALAAAMKELDPVSDYIVLLAYMTEREAAPVVEGIEGIDTMVTMEVTSTNEKIHEVGGVDTFRVSYEGRMVGMLELREGEGGDWKRDLAMTIVVSDAERVPAISRIIDDFKEQVRKDGTGPHQPTTVTDPHPKGTDREILFVGAKSCIECHEAEYHQWQTTPHAKAIDTLIADNSEYNPDCISCHVTGYQQRGGFLDMKRTPAMANVQCEVCHGPGWKHVNSMRLSRYYQNTGRAEKGDRVLEDAKGSIKLAVNEALCIECHQPKTGEFIFDERIPFANHSQPYPEERHHRVNNAVNMMEAFGSQGGAGNGDPAAPSVGGDLPGHGKVEGMLFHGEPTSAGRAFARIVPERSPGEPRR